AAEGNAFQLEADARLEAEGRVARIVQQQLVQHAPTRLGEPPLAPQGTAELPREELDRAAGASGLFLPPLALGLEPTVPDEGGPGLDRATDRVRIEGIVMAGADRLQHIGHDAQECPQGHGGLDAVLPTHPGAREHTRDLLEVVEEEPLRRLAEAIRL